MTKSVLVPIADGIEEIETVCIVDVLRRAGADVTMASVDELTVTASRGVKLVADCRIEACAERRFDLIALPGGMPGAKHLRDDPHLRALLQQQSEQGRLYAAICASPAVVLEHHGLLKGLHGTCHPGLADQLKNTAKIESRVVADGNCITSRGPGTAIEFALTLVAKLFGTAKAREVAEPMLAEK